MSTPIKFRFASKDCETWFIYAVRQVVGPFDWSLIKNVGVRHFAARHIMKGKTKVCQVSLYKTKTLRVVYISCTEPYYE